MKIVFEFSSWNSTSKTTTSERITTLASNVYEFSIFQNTFPLNKTLKKKIENFKI